MCSDGARDTVMSRIVFLTLITSVFTVNYLIRHPYRQNRANTNLRSTYTEGIKWRKHIVDEDNLRIIGAGCLKLLKIVSQFVACFLNENSSFLFFPVDYSNKVYCMFRCSVIL